LWFSCPEFTVVRKHAASLTQRATVFPQEQVIPTVSQVFHLGKSQLELDFVDVSLNKDNPLFIDPFAVAQQVDRWSQDAARTIGTFFQ
jgi:hypothetical protein